jgi:hypothetical protein
VTDLANAWIIQTSELNFPAMRCGKLICNGVPRHSIAASQLFRIALLLVRLGSHCQRRRKGESLHHVSDCKTSRTRLRRLAWYKKLT